MGCEQGNKAGLQAEATTRMQRWGGGTGSLPTPPSRCRLPPPPWPSSLNVPNRPPLWNKSLRPVALASFPPQTCFWVGLTPPMSSKVTRPQSTQRQGLAQRERACESPTSLHWGGAVRPEQAAMWTRGQGWGEGRTGSKSGVNLWGAGLDFCHLLASHSTRTLSMYLKLLA